MEEKVLVALFGRVALLDVGVEVVYPNTEWPKGDAARPEQYILVSHSPGDPERVQISSEAPSRYRGFLQLSLMTPLHEDAQSPLATATAIANHFDTDTRMRHDGVVLRVVSRPAVRGGYRDGDRWRTPIVVTYESVVGTA